MIDPRSLRNGNWIEQKVARTVRSKKLASLELIYTGDFDSEIYSDAPFEGLEEADLSSHVPTDFGFEEISGDIHEVF